MKPQSESNTNNQPVQCAEISWDENGQPISSAFDDVYFSKVSGLEETRHVFIEQNLLPARFASLTDGQVFTIGETGFGSGLNFLCAWHSFLEHAPASARMHFISVEKFPLSRDDMVQALALWPELKDSADQLIKQYPGAIPGFHRCSFADGRVKLTLMMDDVHNAFPQIDGKVNAWFLDGFAPSKNPQMWQPELFTNIADKSAPDATYATFTVARIVRDGLKDGGMSIKKVPGFGRKREMICGEIFPEGQPQNESSNKPWLTRIPATTHNQSAVIIGAGMAGAATAKALAERGWQVTVVDKNTQPALGASGNPQGMLYTRLSANPTPLTQLVTQGYRHTLNLLGEAPEDLYQLCGLVQLPDSNKEQLRQQKLVDCQRYKELLEPMTAQELSDRAGIAIEQDGLYFKDGGWVKPPAFVNWLLAHNNIHFRGNCEVTAMERINDNWQLTLADQTTLTTPVVIIACGHHANALDQTSHLPLKAIRGQITSVPATSASEALRTVICEDGYIAPASHGRHTLGATFHFDDPEEHCRASDHQLNLDNISHFSPAMAQALDFAHLNVDTLPGKVGWRCTTPDYLPMVGPVMDNEVFRERFAVLAKNAKTKVEAEVPWLDGLYINTGHGSRGLITAPLCGELLASQICGELSPLPETLAADLHPGRFPARELIRGTKAL